MHQFCFYLDWAGMPSSEWAAWVQALGSILAILFAGYFPIWHRKIELGLAMDNYVGLVDTALDYALGDLLTIDSDDEDVMKGGIDFSHWDRVVPVFRQIPLHELPHFSLIKPLDQARVAVEDFAKLIGSLEGQPVLAIELHGVRSAYSEVEVAYFAIHRARSRFGGRTPWQHVKFVLQAGRYKLRARRWNRRAATKS